MGSLSDVPDGKPEQGFLSMLRSGEVRGQGLLTRGASRLHYPRRDNAGPRVLVVSLLLRKVGMDNCTRKAKKKIPTLPPFVKLARTGLSGGDLDPAPMSVPMAGGHPTALTMRHCLLAGDSPRDGGKIRAQHPEVLRPSKYGFSCCLSLSAPSRALPAGPRSQQSARSRSCGRTTPQK